MPAVYAQGTAPFSRIHATATEVSRPPENAIPTFCPLGSDSRTLDTRWEPICAGRAAPMAADGGSPEPVRRLAGVSGRPPLCVQWRPSFVGGDYTSPEAY